MILLKNLNLGKLIIDALEVLNINISHPKKIKNLHQDKKIIKIILHNRNQI